MKQKKKVTGKKKWILFAILILALIIVLGLMYFFFLSVVPVEQVVVKTATANNYHMELQVENGERDFVFTFDIDQKNGIQKVDSVISNGSSETLSQYYLDYPNEDMYLVSDEMVTRLDTSGLSDVTSILETLANATNKEKVGLRTYEFTIPKDVFVTELIDKASIVCGYGTCEAETFTDAVATVRLSIFGYLSSITFESGGLSFTYTFEEFGNTSVTLPSIEQNGEVSTDSSNVSIDTGDIIEEP